MTIEEKAKAYDEALEKTRIWQNHLYDINDRDYADELNYIFPELKESEDERIRKELIKHLKDGVEGYMPAGDSEDYARWPWNLIKRRPSVRWYGMILMMS